MSISTPMPLAGHDKILLYHICRTKISTPMPLAGHDDVSGEKGTRLLQISTPMPLAGHDDVDLDFETHRRHFYSHAPRGA